MGRVGFGGDGCAGLGVTYLGGWAVGRLVVVLALAAMVGSGRGAALTLSVEAPGGRVGCFEVIEFRVDGVGSDSALPTRRETVAVEVKGPDGGAVVVPGFLGQGFEHEWVEEGGRRRAWMYPVGHPVWRVRYCPPRVGGYTATAVVRGGGREDRSAPVTFEGVASANHGFVRVSARDPRFFEYTDGTPFFAIGQNLAFVGEGQYVTLARAEAIVGRLGAQGANWVRVWAGCEDWAMGLEARKSAWGRSWDWRPPIVESPGGVVGERCLLLAPGRSVLRVDPSHAVALRPATRYVVTARVRTEQGGTVRVLVQGGRSESWGSGGGEGWREVRHEFTTGPGDRWLRGMSWEREGSGRAWLAGVSLREVTGGPELLWEAEIDRPVRGFYNPVDAHMLDRLLRVAQAQGVHVQLCLATRDVYLQDLKDEGSLAYDRAIGDAQRLWEYAVARWGAYTSLGMWEYWNEMDPNLPTDRFYREVGEALTRRDPYGHLRSTSTWGPSAKDARHPELDVADAHFYLRPPDRPRLRDEVEAVLERAAWLRRVAPAKPAILGEFGLADEQWRPTAEMRRRREVIDFKHGLWASALSGLSGTALFWWWDQLDPCDHYPLYRPLSQFVADVPWTSGDVRALTGVVDDERVRVVGLRAQERLWLWFFHRAASWDQVVVQGSAPSAREGVSFLVEDYPEGEVRVQWVDTGSGRELRGDLVTVGKGGLRIEVPAFSTDVAAKVFR